MVKIRLKILLINILIFVILINIAQAVGSKLIFSDVDVKVGGRTDTNLLEGDTINEQAKPGDNVEFRVKVQNNFTTAENLKIRSITVKTTIEGIDDGSDLEDESNSFDLSPASDKRVTLKFEVPIEVDESTFDVLIHTEGEDKNGTNHEAEMRVKIEINKESHQLKITRKSLIPAEVSCTRKNIQLAATLINIGIEDEKDMTLQIVNPDLGIALRDQINEILAQPNEPESRFSKTYSFNIASDVAAGSYPLTLRALYDNDRKKSEETITLTVNDCTASNQGTKKSQEEKNTGSDGEGVEVTTPPDKTTVEVVKPETSTDTVITQEGIFNSNGFLVGVIIAEVAAVIGGIVLVIFLFKRKGLKTA